MNDFLLLAFIFLISGVIAVPIASKLGLGSVLGYLIAGVLISPLLTLLKVDLVSIQHFAEFGVVMMLFLVGLELEPQILWKMRHKLFGLGGLQVLVTTGLITAIAIALNQAWQVALAIGLVFSLSSTAIVLQTLNEKGLLKSDGGQSSFSVLLFQDIAVIPILALVPLLALPELVQEKLIEQTTSHASESHKSLAIFEHLSGFEMMLVTVAAIAFVLFFGSYLTRPIFRFISVARLRELFTATALMMVIGIALLMNLVGLSPALGTFLAGVVLANSEYRHELESDIAPFKGLLLGLFFITVGANINFSLLSENLGLTLVLTLSLILIKASVLLFLAIVFKVKGADRWLVSLGLAQAGEFGFVLLSFTVASSVVPAPVAEQLMIVIALSMLATPLLFIVLDKIILPYHTKEQAQTDEIEKCEILIIGHGRMGGIVNRMLRASGYQTTVIDFSSAQLAFLKNFNFKVFFGDGTRPDLLHAAGIENAKMLVVAIDNKEHITALVEFAIKSYPHLHVIARAIDRTHVYDLWSVGCRDIIRETYDSSIRMGKSAYRALGHSEAHASLLAKEFEAMDRSSMVEVADLYDRKIPVAENKAYLAKVREIMDEWEAQLLGRMSVHANNEKNATEDKAKDKMNPQ